MAYALFIDDERKPPTHDGRNWIIARDKMDVELIIWREGFPSHVSLDHDLGTDYTGYDIAKWLVDLDMCGELLFPENFTYYVHSQNPIGKANIEGYLDNYLKQRVKSN